VARGLPTLFGSNTRKTSERSKGWREEIIRFSPWTACPNFRLATRLLYLGGAIPEMPRRGTLAGPMRRGDEAITAGFFMSKGGQQSSQNGGGPQYLDRENWSMAPAKWLPHARKTKNWLAGAAHGDAGAGRAGPSVLPWHPPHDRPRRLGPAGNVVRGHESITSRHRTAEIGALRWRTGTKVAARPRQDGAGVGNLLGGPSTRNLHFSRTPRGHGHAQTKAAERS